MNERKNKHFAKWARAELIKNKGGIVTTEWYYNEHKAHYDPEYTNTEIRMDFIMTNEYQRLWFDGLENWRNEAYGKVKKTFDIMEEINMYQKVNIFLAARAKKEAKKAWLERKKQLGTRVNVKGIELEKEKKRLKSRFYEIMDKTRTDEVKKRVALIEEQRKKVREEKKMLIEKIRNGEDSCL